MKVAIVSLSISGSHDARSNGSTASFTETERGPLACAIALLFQLAHSIAVLKAARPRRDAGPLPAAIAFLSHPAHSSAVLKAARPSRARWRGPSRVGAVARLSINRRSPGDSISLTPSAPHQSVSGLPSTPCTHDPPG